MKDKGDLISRSALKKELNFVYSCAYIESKSKEGVASDIIDVIDNAPAVEQNWRFYYDHGYKQAERDLKRPQGEWIFRNGVTCIGYYKCSNCGEVERAEKNFCPNCGAKMQEGGKEE